MAERDDEDRGATELFVALTPERVLDAVEASGLRVTAACFPLNSYENRVYLVQLEDGGRVIAKLYRPGRWSSAQILEEHALLAELWAAEIPVCRALPFPDGETLKVAHGVPYALFEHRPGRPIGDLDDAMLERIGMIAARIHRVGESGRFVARRRFSADAWVRRATAALRAGPLLPTGPLGRRWVEASERIADAADARLTGLRTIRLHGDLHRGNLLLHDGVLQVLDLDDAVTGPAVQDLWLSLPGEPGERERALRVLLAGYERFRPFDRRELAALDVLPAMRRIHYAAWVSRRWDDPLFPRTFPHYAEPAFWEREVLELEGIARGLSPRPVATGGPEVAEDAAPASLEDDPYREELTNADYFWDLDDDDDGSADK